MYAWNIVYKYNLSNGKWEGFYYLVNTHGILWLTHTGLGFAQNSHINTVILKEAT